MTFFLELNLPSDVHLTDRDAKMIVASALFDRGELSSGQAAAVVGISKREFIETVGKYGVSIFQYSADELKEDIARIQRLDET